MGVRETKSETLTIAVSSQTSSACCVNDSISAMFRVPAAIEGATVSFLGAESMTGTYKAVKGSTGAVESVTLSTNSWQPVPDNVCKMHSFKIVAASAQTAARSVTIVKKS